LERNPNLRVLRALRGEEFRAGGVMSCYHLSRFLFDVKMNDALVAKASLNLEAAMQDYDLTMEEKEALRSGDPRKLRQLGVHGMLCLYVKRLSPEFRDNIYWTQK
jgi:hypothetical protein